ncbi:MAG: 30S ribosomal protein S8 [Elusimicrobiota bacterium]
MVVTDTVADMISRIKNALNVKKREVDIPASKLKLEIARLLQEEGYIANYEKIEDNKQGILRIYLKYVDGERSVIRDIKRISRPGKRQYVNKEEIPRVLEGLGRAFISTSRGLLTDKECRKNELGGEVLLYVW